MGVVTCPCPDPYLDQVQEWSDLVDKVAVKTHDIPEDVSDRLSLYIAAVTERYGRSPRFGAVVHTFSTGNVDRENGAAA